jgi:hypothetical protein
MKNVRNDIRGPADLEIARLLRPLLTCGPCCVLRRLGAKLGGIIWPPPTVPLVSRLFLSYSPDQLGVSWSIFDQQNMRGLMLILSTARAIQNRPCCRPRQPSSPGYFNVVHFQIPTITKVLYVLASGKSSPQGLVQGLRPTPRRCAPSSSPPRFCRPG